MGHVDKVGIALRQIREFKRTPEPDREGDVILLIVAPIRMPLLSYPAAEIIAVKVPQVSAEALAFTCGSKAGAVLNQFTNADTLTVRLISPDRCKI